MQIYQIKSDHKIQLFDYNTFSQSNPQYQYQDSGDLHHNLLVYREHAIKTMKVFS